MKAFSFSFQRILEFRQTRLAEEERRLRLLQHEAAMLDRRIEEIKSVRRESAGALAAAREFQGRDLRALANFKARLLRNETALRQKKAICIQNLNRQREAYKVARRDFRLLEELRKRRFAQWQQESNREVDQLASDLYLARWNTAGKS